MDIILEPTKSIAYFEYIPRVLTFRTKETVGIYFMPPENAVDTKSAAFRMAAAIRRLRAHNESNKARDKGGHGGR